MDIKNKKGEIIFSCSSACTIGAALSAAAYQSIPLIGANLGNANLSDQDLEGIKLKDACLDGARFYRANLRHATLDGASCFQTDFYGADLSDCDLTKTDLEHSKRTCANFAGSFLRPKDLKILVSERTIVPDGVLIGYKKIHNSCGTGIICKLRIPARARRIGGVLGRKCRAEYAYVLEGEGVSSWAESFKYVPGKVVRPDKYDPNPLVECSNGIHFFLTELEARYY